MEYALGELFCGPGGIAIGATRSQVVDPSGKTWSIKHQWATDYDTNTCETYRHNISPDDPASVICEDVRELNFDRLAEHGDIDGLAFGFPCNDFSLVGKQKGLDGTFGPLYTYGVKALERFRPTWFFAENVGGLQSANQGQALQKIIREIEDAGPGYIVTPHLYKFEQYGVPQARHRIILIGIKKDLGLTFQPPAPTHNPSTYTSASSALADIPSWASGQEATRQSSQVVSRLSYIEPGENAWDAEERTPEEFRLNVKGARLSQIYRRLHPEKPAYTVTGSGGGGTHIYHWEEPRALTNRERARLQTFPDTFDFVGSKEQVRKQIGMAVPPDGAQIIFEALLKTLAGIDYDAVSVQPRLA